MAKYFISYTSKDSQKAQWIGWTLKKLGHIAFVHEWELRAGQSIAKWMKRRLEECDHLIGVFSPDYIEAEYSESELLAAYWDDPKGQDGFLAPVVIRPCELPKLVGHLKGLDLTDCDKNEARSRLEEFITPSTAPEIEPDFDEVQTNSHPSRSEPPFAQPATTSDPNRFEIHRLPTPHSSKLIGRTEEKALLTEEWTNRENRNIVALIAEGGTGKSFLVSRWLAELKNEKPKPYAGAQRIFTWSFYSQGSKGQITSSEGFFSDLLRSFGENPESYDSHAKAEKALELVCQENMILVLDGVEPLQNPPGHTDAGRFHDRVIGDFVNRLASHPWNGLAIVTSRQRLAELAADEGFAVTHVDVQTLKPEDGAELLASLGVTGPSEEMIQASEEMGGHAFGLVLLGRYLVDVTGDGDIHKRDQVKLLYGNLAGSEKAKAMLQAYAEWFGLEGAETATLHLLGLFDRPAPMAALQAVVAEPAIVGLTEPFHGSEASPLDNALTRLEKLKLITRPERETVDGHPLVREHFGARLKEDRSEAWKQAHSRLFDYFRKIPKDDLPDGEAGLMPLYQSLHHGVAAGRAQEALTEVYQRRIERGGAYGTTQLGLYSTDLAALAAFFPGGWQQAPLQEVSKQDQGYLLNSAGFALQALGRLKEAQGPFEHQIALSIELEDYWNAAKNSLNLSKLLLQHGEVDAALKQAKDTVDFMDKTEHKYDQFTCRVLHANILAMQGNLQQTKTLFEEAEHRQTHEHPEAVIFRPLAFFYFAAFLLHTEPPPTLPGLAKRVRAALQKWVPHNLLTIALNRLNMAQIAARLGDEAARAKFDEAVHDLQKAGTRHHIPRGHIARAAFRRTQRDFRGAWDDLKQARHIAEPSGMRLYLCDALIEEAWLHHQEGNAQAAYKAYSDAKAEVDDMGYHWQDQALDELHQTLA